jgi:hypothetical protein
LMGKDLGFWSSLTNFQIMKPNGSSWFVSNEMQKFSLFTCIHHSGWHFRYSPISFLQKHTFRIFCAPTLRFCLLCLFCLVLAWEFECCTHSMSI